MQFRYRARNYPETLSEEEGVRWRAFCRSRLEDPLTIARFERSLKEVCASDFPSRGQIAADLADYAAGVRAAVA